MKKFFIALMTMLLLVSSSVAIVNAASISAPERVNLTAGLADESVSVTDSDGNEATLMAGFHGGSGNKSIFTDGVIASGATATIVVNDAYGVGWITLDAGAEYVTDRVLVDLVHDWGARNFVIQLSTAADFTDAITVYSNKSGEEFSADNAHATSSVIYNQANRGLTFNFAPVKARYIRVTSDTYGNGQFWNATTIGEIQMWGYRDTVPVYTDTVGEISGDVAKLYAEEGSQIYYTTDGSVPDKNSKLYTDGVPMNKAEVKVRAVAYKDGKYGYPCDFTFKKGDGAVFVSENAALGKSVKAYVPGGATPTVVDHNGGKDLSCITDGKTDPYNSIKFDGSSDQVGFIQVDMEESVWINKVLLVLWHDWTFQAITVQVSDDETFETGVQTIICTEQAGSHGLSQYAGQTIDPDWAGKSGWIQHTDEGFTFNFAPIKGRYIRALAQADGNSGTYCSVYTELQAWTCEEPTGESFTSENIALGKSVTAYHPDGTVATVENHNGGQDLTCITDGKTGTANSIWFSSSVDPYGKVGFIQVDLAESVWIDKIILNCYETWRYRAIAVQVSDDPSFTTGVKTIFCGAAAEEWVGGKGTLDSDWASSLDTKWIYQPSGGFVFHFDPIQCRYVRAMAQADCNDGANYRSTYTELQVWTCEEPSSEEEIYEYGYYLSQVETPEDIEVYVNRNFAELGLPETVKLSYSDGITEKTVDAVWNTNGYDMTVPGDYYVKLNVTDEKDHYGLLENLSVKVTVKAIDLSVLQSIYSEAEKKDVAGYTASCADTFDAARTAAKSVLDKAYKTQEEIDEAARALTDANDRLIARGDVSALKSYLDGLELLAENKYTASTYTAYAEQRAIADSAVAENGNADLTQTDVDGIKTALENVVGKLAFRGDMTALKAVYDAAKTEKGYGEESTNGYNKPSYSAYMEAMYRTAKYFDEAVAAEILQAEVDEAKAALESAIAGLERLADVTAFESAIAVANAVDRAKYTASSLAEFDEAYANMASVVNRARDLFTQAEADEAVASLNAVLNKLVALGDKTALKEAFGSYASEVAADYTASSYRAYREVLYHATGVRNSDDVSQAEVDAAEKALTDAYKALVKLGDRTALSAKIAEAKDLIDTLTGVQKTNTETALNYAETVVAFDGEVTEAQVNEAIALLDEALKPQTGGCESSVGAQLPAVTALAIVLLAAKILFKKRVDDEEI